MKQWQGWILLSLVHTVYSTGILISANSWPIIGLESADILFSPYWYIEARNIYLNRQWTRAIGKEALIRATRHLSWKLETRSSNPSATIKAPSLVNIKISNSPRARIFSLWKRPDICTQIIFHQFDIQLVARARIIYIAPINIRGETNFWFSKAHSNFAAHCVENPFFFSVRAGAFRGG